MKQLNNLFVVLFITIGLLSISYIWNAEENKKVLEAKENEKSQEIALLKDRVVELEESKNEPDNVMGASIVDIGKISGLVIFSNLDSSDNSIVCAQDESTAKEFCTDELLETDNLNEFEYTLEIPKGRYSIYATTPPDSKKTYYSELQKCEGNSCALKNTIKAEEYELLEVAENETQENVDIYF